MPPSATHAYINGRLAPIQKPKPARLPSFGFGDNTAPHTPQRAVVRPNGKQLDVVKKTGPTGPVAPAPTHASAPVVHTPAPTHASAPVVHTPAPTHASAPVVHTPAPTHASAPVVHTPAPTHASAPVVHTPAPPQNTANVVAVVLAHLAASGNTAPTPGDIAAAIAATTH